MFGVLSSGITGLPYLEEFLSGHWRAVRSWESGAGIDSIVGWGRKGPGLKAERFAKRIGVPFISLEDGFLRSVGLGHIDSPLSIVKDDLGIYYDCNRPSRLEALICKPITDFEQDRARQIVETWCRFELSKYNYGRKFNRSSYSDYVLVIDQTEGDASVRLGGADAASFKRMLECAISENPDKKIFLKVHPDVICGRKKGYFDLNVLKDNPQIKIIAGDYNPSRLIKYAKRVYTVTSQIGFETLLWGRPLTVFGRPFYAGWGLTTNEESIPRRVPVSLYKLVYACLVEYPVYVHPERRRRCEIEEIMAWLNLQQCMRSRFPKRIIAVGFSKWKQRYVESFLSGSEVKFISNLRHRKLISDNSIAVWGNKNNSVLEKFDPKLENTVLRIEDGFLRSVGLGAHFTRPLSWVVDDLGIYYDASRPSRLESLLSNFDFDEALLSRARKLLDAICQNKITKYNIAAGNNWTGPGKIAKQTILVIGQVETDASIQFGSTRIFTNFVLLSEARANNPESYIVYRPHPDVEAGVRALGRDERSVSEIADEIATGDISFNSLIECVDEVHVMTSLAGFEALMRGKTVVTYGQPFYAGWGLTVDLGLSDQVRRRRQRVLILDQLVAASLLLYPTYVSRITSKFTTAEQALDELIDWRSETIKPNFLKRCVARLTRTA